MSKEVRLHCDFPGCKEVTWEKGSRWEGFSWQFYDGNSRSNVTCGYFKDLCGPCADRLRRFLDTGQDG